MDYENLPKVSLVIPCRNEERHIKTFLNSLTEIEYPKHKLEIIFIDGMSIDNTKEIILSFRDQLLVSVIDNPKKITPVALNIGIKNSSGEYVIILSSHTKIPKDFVIANINTILNTNADCVGGVIRTESSSDRVISKAISFVLSNRFGVGDSIFRTGTDKLMEVDTVPYGCYKKSAFEKFGYFNENLVRNQDIELNLRIKNGGGKIILNPKIQSVYFSRDTLKDLFQQNFWNGFWVFYSLKFAKLPFSIRHTIPAIFVSTLIISLMLSKFSFFRFLFIITIGSYMIANIYFSFQIAKSKGFKYFLSTVISFFTLHFSYGLGSLWGIIRYLVGK
jgi:glycosyltransferase involved in cell wall biosynthesis